MAENDTSSTGVSDEKSTAYGGQSRNARRVAFLEPTQKVYWRLRASEEEDTKHDDYQHSDDDLGHGTTQAQSCVGTGEVSEGEKKSTTYRDHSSNHTESRIEKMFQVSVHKDESDGKHDGNKTSDDMRQTEDGRNRNKVSKGEKKSTTYRYHSCIPTDLDLFLDYTEKEKFNDRHDGNKTSDAKRQMQDGTPGNKAPQLLLQALYDEENLYKNEKGKYEWQWRQENGWDERRKRESTNLEDVYRTRKKERGFMIKTKDGYRWILTDECIGEDDIRIDVHGRAEDLKRLPMGKKAKIIFIGPVGSGKSATINTLLGENSAPSETNLQGNYLTKDTKEYNSEYGILVDSPGLTEENLPSILSYLDRNPPDVIVFVFAASRLKSSETDAIKNINSSLGAYFDKAFLLLTKGGDLQENEKELDFLCQDKSKELFSLYRRVGRRYVVFENTASLDQKSKYNCKFKDSIHRIINPRVDSLLQRFLRNVRNFFSFRR